MMHFRFAILLAASSLVVVGASAQDSLSREVTLPSGTVITRKCAKWESEGILILTADPRINRKDLDAYLAQLATEMERRLTHVAKDSVALVASFAGLVMRDGSVGKVRLMKGSGRAGFNMEAQRALTIGPSDALLSPMPDGLPDSLNVFISIGRNQNGSKFLVPHESCAAVPYPNNPMPVYPLEATISRTRTVIETSFVVDTTGMVDTTSIKVLTQTTDAFGDATLDYLATLKYLPAEFDGRKERQEVFKSVEFFIPEQSGSGND
jgi:hypothetical protein